MGQLKTDKPIKRVTFRSNTTFHEYSEETDEILESLESGETDVRHGVDFDLSNIQDEITEMLNETNGFTYSYRINLSSSKDYTNLNSYDSDQNFDIPEEDLYNLPSTDILEIGILKELKLKISKFFKLEYENILVKSNLFFLKRGKELPRFSCANHKLSIAINSSFIKHGRAV